ncbi:MAG: PAS domain S-box protein [Burkholderiales bacterium]
MSIGARLLTLVLGVVVPVAAVLVYLLFVYLNAEIDEGRDNLRRLADQYAGRVGRDVRDARLTLSRIASLPGTRKMDPAQCGPAFTVIPALDPLVDQLALRRLDGSLVCSYLGNARAVIPTSSPWFALGIERGTFTASDAWLGRNTGRWVTVLTYPVLDEAGRRVGMLALPIDLAELRKRNLGDLPAGRAASVIGTDGRFLMRSIEHDKWVGKSVATEDGSAAERRSVPGAGEMRGVDGVERLRASAKVPGTDWVLVAGVHKAMIVDAAWARAEPALTLAVLLLVILAPAGYVFGRSISRPIRRIGSAARAVAAGDSNVRLEPTGPAELRDLAREFNRMLEARVLIDRETHTHQQWASSVIENVGDMVAIVARDGIIKYVSPSIRQIGGYAPQELVGRSYLEFLHPDEHAEGLTELEQIMQTTASVRLKEKRFLRKDGRWARLEAVAKNALHEPTIAGVILNARDISERTQAQEQLRLQATVLRTQQETSLDGILLVDENARIVSYNQKFLELWKVPQDVVRLGDDAPLLQWVTDRIADPAAFRARVGYLYEHRDEKARDEILCMDGRIIDRFTSPVIGAGGRYYGRVWYFRDITAQREAEERIQRLNLLYATLSGANSAIVRSTSRAELFRSVCKVIAGHGGWIGAWIGFVDPATRRIVPEAWTDSMAGQVAALTVSVDPALPQGQGPSGIATRSGAAYFSNDVFSDSAAVPWRQFCLDFGVASTAAVPLSLGSATVGVINLYSAKKGFYTPDVQALLIELGDDVSFALQTLDSERRRHEAEAALADSEAKYRGLVEQNLTGIYIIQGERFVYVNPHFAELFGYRSEELVGMEFRDLVAEPDRALVEKNVRRRIVGEAESMQYSFRGRRKDGSWFDVGVHGSRSLFGGRPAVIGLLQDITARRKSEEQAKTYLIQLEQAMMGTIDAVSAMVELRDPYTSGHERRVSELAGAIGQELGLAEDEIKGLRIAGALHDIGKIACPAEILSKPTRLTAIEFEIVKAHPQLGYDILKSVPFSWPVAQAVLQHHERLDGSGYPQKLKGEEIILSARILAVADTIEAMASHRPYRPALGIDAALAEVEKHSGTRFDPRVAAACLRLFREKNYVLPV